MGNTLEEFAVEKIRELEAELKKADEIIESQQKQINEFNDMKILARKSLYIEDSSFSRGINICTRWNTSRSDAEKIVEYFDLVTRDFFEDDNDD